MNALNRRVFQQFDISRLEGAARRFVLSSTTLTRDEYGDAPAPFLRSMGVPAAEWARVRELFLLRAVVLSPHIAGTGLAQEFTRAFRAAAAASA
jgi:hypothetical protein